MPWVKCRKCNKRVGMKKAKCPACGSMINIVEGVKDYTKITLKVLYVIIQVGLMGLLWFVSREVLYSEEVSELFFLFATDIILILSALGMGYFIYKGKDKRLQTYLMGLVVIVSLVFGTIYLYKGIGAFRYENSWEFYNLAERFEYDNAKKFKKNLEKVVEYENGDISVRNIRIKNMYIDNGVYVLYIEDFYQNYQLKLYLNLDNYDIIDCYYMYRDEKIYLVKNKKLVEDFDFYYAMMIVDVVMGENIEGLATIEEDVSRKLKDYFEESANIIISYEQLIKEKDNYYYKCSVHNMDFMASSEEKEFIIKFSKRDEAKTNKVWYYGDSSFDYVDWSIQIK